MSLRKRLVQKGVTNSQIAIVAQGFVDLLADQLALSSALALQAKTEMRRGKTKIASKRILQVGKTMKHAELSQEMATLLLGQEDRG